PNTHRTRRREESPEGHHERRRHEPEAATSIPRLAAAEVVHPGLADQLAQSVHPLPPLFRVVSTYPSNPGGDTEQAQCHRLATDNSLEFQAWPQPRPGSRSPARSKGELTPTKQGTAQGGRRNCALGLDDSDDQPDGGQDVPDAHAFALDADLHHRLARVVD